jgi:hypothetical protein
LSPLRLLACGGLALIIGCGPQTGGDPFGSGNGDGNGAGEGDGGMSGDLATSAGGDGGGVKDCTGSDLTGCGCPMAGQTRACYTGPAGTDGVGLCHDGTQTCAASGEFAAWGPCTGDATPQPEQCQDGQDHDCDGTTGCDDTSCGGMAGCCQTGQTRPCYDGPNGTEGKGQCHGGMQTCDETGAWSVGCPGEVTPGSELGQCTDGVDNDCNGNTDCKDLLCLLDPACAPQVCDPNMQRACYDGPNGTEGVGPCHGGTQTCAADGKSWGPCNGEALPGSEGGHCADGIDNDCNGLVDCKDPACATAPSCCTMGNQGTDGTIYANSPTTLYRVDPNNFAVTTVGDFNDGDQMTDIALTPGGALYGISFTSFYAVDKNNGQATKLGDLGGTANNALTFLPDGSLIAADGNGDAKHIDPANAQVAAIGNYGDGLVSAGDLVGVGDGRMYGISSTQKGGGDASGNNVLLRVDPNSGKATAVGPIGFGSVWGLAYAGARVIAFTTNGEIVQVDPQTGKGTLLANKNIMFWGATQSPLVPENQCP